MQLKRHIIVLVIPQTEIFLRLAGYARKCLSAADFELIIAAQETLSLWEHFKRRRRRVGVARGSLEALYCILEGYITPWAAAAERLGLRIIDHPNIILTREAFSQDLAEVCIRNEADILISMGCEKIDLNFFSLDFKAINIHPGILPAYRGVGNPEALLKSDFGNLGVSIHQLTMALDQGALISQALCPEIKGMSIPEGYLYCYLRAIELLAAQGGSLIRAPISQFNGLSLRLPNRGKLAKNIWHLTIFHFLHIKFNILLNW